MMVTIPHDILLIVKDASGSASVLEAFRIIAQSDFEPERTIEFHAYAAEEMGLRGSQAIAQNYKSQRKRVYAMMQLDMTGYHPRKTQIALIRQSSSSSLNAYVKMLASEYTKAQAIEKNLFGGTSDHASWNRAGYPACFPFEVDSNPYIHTARDTIDRLDFNFGKEYVKLAIAFAIEASLATQ
jgi:leucyl aminopeptidase